MTLHFKSYNSNGKSIKGKPLKIVLALTYYPCRDPAQEKFVEALNGMLSKFPKRHELLLGADINAKLGTRD